MPEVPLQYDLFTGSLVDRRTRTQKEQDKLHQQPTQLLMFSQRDIAHTDVNPHPRMNVSPGPLVLIREDPRTEEEREADTLREAQSLTASFLPPEPEKEETEAGSPKGISESSPLVSQEDPHQRALLNLEAVIASCLKRIANKPVQAPKPIPASGVSPFQSAQRTSLDDFRTSPVSSRQAHQPINRY